MKRPLLDSVLNASAPLFVAVALSCSGSPEPSAPTGRLWINRLTTVAEDDENAGCPYYDPYCNVKPLTVEEEQAVQFQIDHMFHWDSSCEQLKMDLQMRLWSGQIRAFSNATPPIYPGDYHVFGPVQGQIHLRDPITMWAQGNLGWYMLHESAHSTFGVGDNYGYQDANWWANYCWMGD